MPTQQHDPESRRRKARTLYAIIGFAAGIITVILAVRYGRLF